LVPGQARHLTGVWACLPAWPHLPRLHALDRHLHALDRHLHALDRHLHALHRHLHALHRHLHALHRRLGLPACLPGLPCMRGANTSGLPACLPASQPGANLTHVQQPVGTAGLLHSQAPISPTRGKTCGHCWLRHRRAPPPGQATHRGGEEERMNAARRAGSAAYAALALHLRGAGRPWHSHKQTLDGRMCTCKGGTGAPTCRGRRGVQG